MPGLRFILLFARWRSMSRQAVGGATHRLHVLLLLFLHFKLLLYFVTYMWHVYHLNQSNVWQYCPTFFMMLNFCFSLAFAYFRFVNNILLPQIMNNDLTEPWRAPFLSGRTIYQGYLIFLLLLAQIFRCYLHEVEITTSGLESDWYTWIK